MDYHDCYGLSFLLGFSVLGRAPQVCCRVFSFSVFGFCFSSFFLLLFANYAILPNYISNRHMFAQPHGDILKQALFPDLHPFLPQSLSDICGTLLLKTFLGQAILQAGVVVEKATKTIGS